MKKRSSPPEALSAAESRLSDLAATLPEFVVSFRSDRVLLGLLCASLILTPLGVCALVAAMRVPGLNWLKPIGWGVYISGVASAWGYLIGIFVVTVLRLRRADQLLLARLDDMWEEEWRTINGLVDGKFDKLAARARWLKLHGQLLDRTASRVALLGALATGTLTLVGLGVESGTFSHQLSIQVVAFLKAVIKFSPAALGTGFALAALFHHRLASKLSRLEFMVSEAAQADQALASAKTRTKAA